MSNNQIRKAINRASAKGDLLEIKRLSTLLHNNKKKFNYPVIDLYIDMKPIYLIV